MMLKMASTKMLAREVGLVREIRVSWLMDY
jgi:hypothetical protein